MINVDRPTGEQEEANLIVGSGFLLLIGGLYNLIITPALTGMLNLTKASSGLSWATITTTWASETDTWLGVSQIIDNTTKPSTSISNVSKP